MNPTGVLSIPSALYSLGSLPGAIVIIFWGFLNTYCAIILGNFRTRHPGCHSIADMADIVGGVVLKEVVGLLFMVAYTICVSSGFVGAATGLNALSNHAICTCIIVIQGRVSLAMEQKRRIVIRSY